RGIYSVAVRLRSFNRKQIPPLIESFTRLERRIILAAFVVFLLTGGFLLTKVFINQGPGPHNAGEIVEGLVGQPQFINPVLALTNNVDTDISRIVYAQILKY